jgi:hypothetical protein
LDALFKKYGAVEDSAKQAKKATKKSKHDHEIGDAEFQRIQDEMLARKGGKK